MMAGINQGIPMTDNTHNEELAEAVDQGAPIAGLHLVFVAVPAGLRIDVKASHGPDSTLGPLLQAVADGVDASLETVDVHDILIKFMEERMAEFVDTLAKAPSELDGAVKTNAPTTETVQ